LSVRQSVRDYGALSSDLNQWILKVLLAPELPEALLSAPRGQNGNASQLARAANVSVMTAFRFVQQFGREGYMHESAPYLRLVRREDLFSRWQAPSGTFAAGGADALPPAGRPAGPAPQDARQRPRLPRSVRGSRKPWSVRVGPGTGVPIEADVDLFLPNATSFIVQRLLIHSDRPANKEAQDAL
jgi:hypothetical protein